MHQLLNKVNIELVLLTQVIVFLYVGHNTPLSDVKNI